MKSNKIVENIINALTTQFLNPFDADLDKSELYNLVSGCPVADEVSDSLLNLEKAGEELFRSFEERMTKTESPEEFFDPIRKFKWKTFRDSENKVKIKKDGRCKEVMFQRDILGKLVALSHKHRIGVDLDSVLVYPLAPICLPLSTPDGAIRKTAKSKLFSAAMSDLTIISFEDLPPPEKMQIYLLDLAAAIRSIVGKVTTIRALASKIMASIPHQYKTVYVVCDTYRINSIKSGERQARGVSARYVLNSPDMKIPYDFDNFLKNGDNKEMLFNLIQQSIEDDKESLGEKVLYFSNKVECKKITQNAAEASHELMSDHEEADTKLVALVRSSTLQPGNTAMIRSPSGDTDIVALFLGHEFPDVQILIDNGTGKDRKIIDVTSSELSASQKKALLGMHAFSGNDYVSCFFRKGKQAVWKAVNKKTEFIDLFASLGDEVAPSEELVLGLEKFVCFLYGHPRLLSVNEARRKVFWQKFNKDEKIVYLSLMPPCKSNLHYHIMRANYVAYLFRQADHLVMHLESPERYGWDADGKVVWSDNCYPNDINEFLLDEENGEISSDDDEYEDDMDIEMENIDDF